MSVLEHTLELARGALSSLETSRTRIDDLNVYPVPDGDTGTNLTLTLRAVVEALEQSQAVDRPTIAREVTRAALMGARGNSGVIFSQIVRGAADVLGGEDAIDERLVARALRSAADAAYRGVRKPVEGTMLSAIRALADEAECAPDDLWASLVRAGEAAVARTPEQLDVLRDAGVVDAGAAGLVEIFRGVAAAVTGEAIAPPPTTFEEVGTDAVHLEPSRYRYCTTFVVEGDELDVAAVESKLEPMGDSLLVVGDPSALKIHLHTDDPGAALSVGTAIGAIDRVEIANMHEQARARDERLLRSVDDAPATSIVAVVAGDGNRRLFESLGAARIVEGGQSMNPSAGELVAAIDGSPGAEVIVLPNNSNVILTAEQAARMASKPTRVVPTDTLQTGLAALVLFDPARSLRENSAEMEAAVAGVATGEVTLATRDAELDGLQVRKGRWLGLVEGRAVAGGDDFAQVAEAVAEQLLSEPRGLLTLLTGAEEPELDGLLERLRVAHPDLEIDVERGGQPHYPLLLSAE